MAKQAKKLSIDPDVPLGPALEAALAGVVSYAESWAQRAEEAPQKAVHAYRKSLRRARAVVKLMRDLLGPEAYAELNATLRDATRPTSPLRDADVLVELATDAPRKKSTQAVLDALTERLTARRDAQNDPSRVARMLAQHAEEVHDLPRRFGDQLPNAVSRQDLHHALKRSYGRARKAYRRARKTGRDEDVHAWRKRVKELRYQLEMLEELTGETPEHRTLAALAEELGRVTDGIVLREAALAAREGLPEGGLEKLLAWLEARTARLLAELLAHGEAFFHAPPRAFVTRILHGVRPSSGAVQRSS